MASERRNLTDRWLEKARISGKAERRHVYDAKLQSFGVTLYRSGKKSFFIFRRMKGRPVRIHIGTFPATKVPAARAEAGRKIALIEQGKDPRPEIVAGRTLGAFFENYRERQLRVYSKNPDKAISNAEWLFKRFLEPWRDRAADAIRRHDVAALHARIGANHGHCVANRAAQLLRAIFNWAIDAEIFEGANPASRVKYFPEFERTRYLQPSEMPKFLETLRDEANADLRDFIWLALMTGARKSDVLSMRWRDLNLDAALWLIPSPKSGQPYHVALVPEAIEVLKRRRGVNGGEWVFPSTGKTQHVVDLKRSWGQFRKRAGLGDVRVHDLRRSLGSWMAGGGASLLQIGGALGHQDPAATKVYARMNLDSIREQVEGATRRMLTAAAPEKSNRGKQ